MREYSCVQPRPDPRALAAAGARGQQVAVLDPDAAQRPARPLPLSPALRAQQARELRRRIAAYLAGDLELLVTDNRAVMISVQRDPRHKRYHVRLHHLFVAAPTPVLQALARYIGHNDRVASKQLNAYIDEHTDRIRQRRSSKQRPPIRTRGRIYDLRLVWEEINRAYFDGRVSCQITWGRHVGRGRSRRSIKVGSYSLEENLIRIHPGLDQSWIPPFYLQWVVYHEMLHAAHPAPLIRGRHQFHTPAFASEERRFSEYSRAIEWERRNVAALLCI